MFLVCKRIYSSQDYPVLKGIKNSGPNDLFVTNSGYIYFTCPAGFVGSFIFKKPGFIGYISEEGSGRLIDGLLYPNGIAVIDNFLYCATTKGNTLVRYQLVSDIQIATSPPEILSRSIRGGDNISVCGDRLIIAHHPKPIRFIFHALWGAKSPSSVVQYNLNDNTLDQLFYDSGKNISTSSTALTYKNSLYISQVFQNFLLRVRLDSM